MAEHQVMYKAPDVGYCKGTKIFLAGSIEMGAAEMWQDKVFSRLKEISDKNFTVFNPRRDDWDSSWIQDPYDTSNQFYKQVKWELRHINMADLVFFYFDPNTKSPVTMLELGVCLGDLQHADIMNYKKNVIVVCPKGFFRYGNVVITCKEFDVDVLSDFEEGIQKLKELL